MTSAANQGQIAQGALAQLAHIHDIEHEIKALSAESRKI